ncbi:MAG: VOC family protein [Pseudomonadota bacterium]
MRPVHHINLVVPSLDAVVDQFAIVTGVAAGPEERLEARGVALRRFDLGGTWLVLVAPTRDDSPAALWLARHGSGLFLLSFATRDLDAALADLEARGIASQGEPRNGLDDWRVADLATDAFAGLPLQLTQAGGSTQA